MLWFWSFVIYGFFGFLLEVAFASVTGGRPDRKGLLVLPLCPVYGAGACLILLLPPWVQAQPWALYLLGGLAAAGVEYLAAVYHQRVLGVRFWDYDGLPGSIQGRVCLPFTLVWGMLALGLVYWFHPILAPWLVRVPALVSWMALLTLTADSLFTALVLHQNQNISCLRWYRKA